MAANDCFGPERLPRSPVHLHKSFCPLKSASRVAGLGRVVVINYSVQSSPSPFCFNNPAAARRAGRPRRVFPHA